jgi:hypothetical protein
MSDKEKIARLLEALAGMLMEWDQLTRYGSPMAKAANERVTAARAAMDTTKDAPDAAAE